MLSSNNYHRKSWRFCLELVNLTYVHGIKNEHQLREYQNIYNVLGQIYEDI